MYVLDLDPTEKDTNPKVRTKKGEVRFSELLAVLFSSLTQCGERIES